MEAMGLMAGGREETVAVDCVAAVVGYAGRLAVLWVPEVAAGIRVEWRAAGRG